jgi:hypothetical protein
MNYKRLLNTKVGIIFISIMLGLGLAVLFRSACNGKDCLIFKGPKFSDIKGKTYQFGDSCYKYNAVSSKCDSNKQALAFLNDKSKYSEFEGFADSSTKVDLHLDDVNSFVSKLWNYITISFYYMTLG